MPRRRKCHVTHIYKDAKTLRGLLRMDNPAASIISMISWLGETDLRWETMLRNLRILGLLALCGLCGCPKRTVTGGTPPPPPPPIGPVTVTPVGPIGQGEMSGTVTDQTGAVVPDTIVTVYGGGVEHSTKSDAGGQYSVSGLPSGTYSVLFSRSGFSQVKIVGAAVNPDQSAHINVVLKVEFAEAVSVGGPPPVATIEGFPINPPTASARTELPPLSTAGGRTTKTLGDFDKALSKALDQVGYGTKGYYSYPDGFALATKMEQIYPDGRSMPPPNRFSRLPPVPKVFSIAYLKGIVAPREGYFRVIVFIVTDQPIIESDVSATQNQAENWPSKGATSLPSKVAKTDASSDIAVTAFIYEFKNSTDNDSSKLELLDTATIEGSEQLLDAKQHLQEAGLWGALGLP
jgi:Carboxypeptidase regulatory-like domain